jgi:16S rRNA (guanine966-N2)-methyltransferase
LFNILTHGQLTGDGIPFAGAAVLDAFAGTGAFGLEALSRGAAEAFFIERDPEAVAVLRRNVASLGESAHAELIPGDATRPPRARAPCAVVFIDPPYGSGLAGPALEALDSAGWLKPDTLVIVELAAREELPSLAGFMFLDERVYGAARLVFLRRDATLGPAPDTPRNGGSP